MARLRNDHNSFSRRVDISVTSKKMYRSDAPENARLFILSGRGIKEEVFREKFEHFGKIEDLWVVKDKRTNEDKGKRKCDACF